MNTLLHPVGQQPARVYWVRRLVVLVAVLVAATLVWTLAQGGGGPSAAVPGDQASPTDQTDDDAGSDDDGDSGQDSDTSAAAPCAAGDLDLEITADQNSYAADEEPIFTVTITNTGDSGCTVDAGDATREILVTSGSDRIWSSVDCAEGESASRNLLLGGGKADKTNTSWARERSNESCGEGLPEPRPGTYRAEVKLNGATSEHAVFVLE